MHPTSLWALRYGLPDPDVPARAVLAARPDQVRVSADWAGIVAGGVDDGAAIAARAAAVLADGWSTPAAQHAVEALVVAARTVADRCRGIGAATAEYAAALQSDRAAVPPAYARADAAIADAGLLAEPPIWTTGEVIGERCDIVQTLYRAVDAVADRLDDAALRLCAGIGPDPHHGLPAASDTIPGPFGPPQAAELDAGHRDQLAADLRGAPQRRLFAHAVQQALSHAAAGGAPVQLLAYDPLHPTDQGGAAIAIGDVAHADSVAVLVPGVTSSPSDMSGPLDSAARLVEATAATAPDTTTATVVWLGYDVPASWMHDDRIAPGMLWRLTDSMLAVNAADATAGGAALAKFSRSLRAMMQPSAGLTLVGHSYGSTVVSQAATRLDADAGVDDIVLLGSPGVGDGLDAADDYSAVPADHVYTLAFPRDPVPSTGLDLAAGLLNPIGSVATHGPFGVDPNDPDFGAEVIAAPSSAPVRRGAPPWWMSLATGGLIGPAARAGAGPINNLNQHEMSNYLDGAALTAVAAVVAGRYARVPVRRRR